MSTQLRFTSLLLLLSQVAVAQTERGVNWWSGGVGTRSGQTELYQDISEQQSLDLSLTQGTFVRSNLLVGADLRYTRTRDLSRRGLNFDAVTDSRNGTISVVPFVRHFWGKQALRGYFGGGLSVSYGRNRIITANTFQRGSENQNTNWQVSPEVQAGLFYSIKPHWGIDLNARSSVIPLVFGNLNLGLVVLTGVKTRARPEPRKTPNQLLTGNWLVGGSFSVGSQQRKLISATEQAQVVQSQTTQLISLRPSFGYMAGNRWVVGVAIPIRNQTVTNEFLRSARATTGGGADVITKGIGLEPFVKKYLLSSRFGPYVGAQGGWITERTIGSAGGATTRYSLRVSGGLAYMLGQRFIAEAEVGGLGHEWSNTTVTNESSNQTNFALTLRPALSLTYVFL
ncbi:hypothetical protein J2I47_25755 [Fibrella sp. HMF5335]|uniref:Outer membrane protein beta-barrel domain-containing protein n=1 Tax=Fibrella rubiginis TaxID=2817060 RepID=A0A939GP04_9BACT|nr:hypothetical protein [Fibrella rubiginis]MBO0939977.1 hypothetical protein [Fibrella rubiginis]